MKSKLKSNPYSVLYAIGFVFFVAVALASWYFGLSGSLFWFLLGLNIGLWGAGLLHSTSANLDQRLSKRKDEIIAIQGDIIRKLVAAMKEREREQA